MEAKKIYNRYKRDNALLLLGFALAVVLFTVLGFYIAAVAVFGVYIIFMRRFTARRYEKNILSILFVDLDGKKYKSVIACDKHAKAQWEYLYACMYSGDYDEVVSFCNAALKRNKINESVKCVMYLHLAKAYFETGNDQALRTACEDYRRLVDSSPNKEQLVIDQMEIYENYLDGDFDRALSLNEQRYEQDGVYTARLNNSCALLYKALLVYRMGDTEKAKPLFEQIAEDYPLLSAADIASRHLKFLNGETDSLILPCADTDDTAVEQMSAAYKRFIRTSRTKQILTIVIILAAFFLAMFVTPSAPADESTAALLNGIKTI